MKEANKLFSTSKGVVYKPFSQLVRKIYSIITNSIGYDLDFKMYLDAFLKNTFIQVVSKYKSQYIITYQNISDLMLKRDQNYQVYRNVIIVSSI